MELSLFPDNSNERKFLLNDSSGSIEVISKFDSEHNPLSKHILDTFLLKQESIRLFGKEVLQPRLSSFFGDAGINYTYSQRNFQALPWNAFLEGLNQRLSTLDFSMNSALVNYYRDGTDSMGLHADDEPELRINPTILSLNYGSTRKMIFRKNETKEKLQIELNHGDLLIMSGALQHNWKHEIPKQRKVTAPRMNITFRQLKN